MCVYNWDSEAGALGGKHLSPMGVARSQQGICSQSMNDTALRGVPRGTQGSEASQADAVGWQPPLDEFHIKTRAQGGPQGPSP